MQDIVEQIEIEKKHEEDVKKQIKAHGELLTNIRAALQNMNIMLLCVRPGKGIPKKLKNGNKKEAVIDKDDEREELTDIEGTDTDGKQSYNY